MKKLIFVLAINLFFVSAFAQDKVAEDIVNDKIFGSTSDNTTVKDNTKKPARTSTEAIKQEIKKPARSEDPTIRTAPTDIKDVDTTEYESKAIKKNPNDLTFYWLMIGVNGFIPLVKGDQIRDTYYTIDAKGGVNFYKFLGAELNLGYYMQPGTVNTGYNTTKNTISSERVDIRLYLLAQPEIKITPTFKLIPYAGVGVNFTFIPDKILFQTTQNSNSSYDVSINVAAKAGLRGKVSPFIFGVGVEYINVSAKYLDKRYDLSNINIGAEFGLAY